MQITTTFGNQTVEVKIGLDRELWIWEQGKGQIILAYPLEAIDYIKNHCELKASQHELNWIEWYLNPPAFTKSKFERKLVIRN